MVAMEVSGSTVRTCSVAWNQRQPFVIESYRLLALAQLEGLFGKPASEHWEMEVDDAFATSKQHPVRW